MMNFQFMNFLRSIYEPALTFIEIYEEIFEWRGFRGLRRTKSFWNSRRFKEKSLKNQMAEISKKFFDILTTQTIHIMLLIYLLILKWQFLRGISVTQNFWRMMWVKICSFYWVKNLPQTMEIFLNFFLDALGILKKKNLR